MAGDKFTGSDADLLQRFISSEDPAAASAIIERHGPLVMGLCRGILRNEQDAADAFQSTFLVLLKNARSISKPESLASWLHGVACRVAVRAKTQAHSRRHHEFAGAAMPNAAPSPSEHASDAETVQLVHEELSRLPEQLRLPLILCGIQGRTREEAAEQLGWSQRSVKDRLERARAMLHNRLTRRGVALPAAAITGLLAQQATAAVPAALAASTVKALLSAIAGQAAAGGVVSAQVASLTKGVLISMKLAKLKSVALVTAALLFLGGSSIVIVNAVGVRLPNLIPNSPPEWLRGTGDNLEIRLTGRVVDADGRPASGVVMSGHTPGSSLPLAAREQFDVKVDGSAFEVWIPVNRTRLRSLLLKASSTQNDHVAYHTVRSEELRQAAIDGLTITLEAPSRQLKVKVLSEGQPVANASVIADASWYHLRVSTNEDGIAEFNLLPRQKLYSLTAFTGDSQIGGFSFHRNPPRDPLADEHTIELSPCHDQKLLFVQADGTPVSGLDFIIQMATPAPNFNFVGTPDEAEFRMKTDAEGAATYHWFPNWDSHYFYPELQSDKWLVDGDPQPSGDVVRISVKRRAERKRVAGRIHAAATAAAGFFVELQSFEGELESMSDMVCAFTDADGRFSVDVLRDATYCAFLVDSRWVSPTVHLIPYDSALDRVTQPELEVLDGQEVEIIATAGPDNRPIANLDVHMRRPYFFSWIENGESRSGSSGPRWYATTDEHGRATVRTFHGELEAAVYEPTWRAEEKIEVEPARSATLTIHRAVEHPQHVTGKLLVFGGVVEDLREVEIRAAAIDGQTNGQQTLTPGLDGTFAFDVAATSVGVFARSRDGQFAGAAVADDLRLPIELTLVPTTSYHGRLVGADDRPIPNHVVEATVRVGEDRWTANSAFPKSFEGLRIEAQTDEDGAYVLRGLPSGIPISLWSWMPGQPDDRRFLDTVFLTPGEPRPVAVSKLTAGIGSAATSTLPDRYERMLRDCALGGYHLMLILPSSGVDVDAFVSRHLTNPDAERVPSYLQLVVTPAEIENNLDVARFLTEHQCKMPEDAQVFACALDTQGHELGRVLLNIRDASVTESAAEFLNRCAPAQADAQQQWDAAFAEAQRTNRRVWARVSQRYCGPCFRFARWLDDQRSLLEKDYVLLKIDDVRDVHGTEVAERLTLGESHGVPFHAIFDIGGDMLVSSAGPTGNVGYPSGFEGHKHLRAMLQATRRNLTDSEVEQLVESVEE